MTTHTKEEQERLEEKIARIQKKEEEILRRKKEIEEDIRLAEQKDALVKLRPSTTNLSRERTPALKPSNRELREDFSDESFQEPVQKSTRDSFRGRGVERYRGQGDWKTTGPPPDPKSFLYDDERDAPSREKEGKEDLRQKLDRRNRDDRERTETEELRGGGREFQRGGGRRGTGNDMGSRRGPRGRRGGADDTAWRAERLRIDEARIERQKAADGRWRREWDNEKVDPEFEDEQPRFEQRRDLEHRRGCPQHHHQDQHDHRDHDHHHHHHHDHHHHGHHDHHDHQHGHHDHQHSHGPSYVPASVPRQLPREVHGRGRGRFDPAQLEMPHIEVLKTPGAPAKESPKPRQSTTVEKPPSPQMKVVRHSPRSVECVGSSVKISIANARTTGVPKSDHLGLIPNTNSIEIVNKNMSEEIERHRKNRVVAFSHAISADLESPRNMSAGVAVTFRKHFGKPSKLDFVDSQLTRQSSDDSATVYSLVTKAEYNHKPTLDDYSRAFAQFREHFKGGNHKVLICSPMGCVRDKVPLDLFAEEIVRFQRDTGAHVKIVTSDEPLAGRVLFNGYAHNEFIDRLRHLILNQFCVRACEPVLRKHGPHPMMSSSQNVTLNSKSYR